MGRIEPKNCQATISLLERFCDRDLPESEENAVRDHLTGCTACRALAGGLDPSVLFLELRGRELPEGFWAGFTERLRPRLQPARFLWSDLFRYPRLAYFTGPVALLLILGVALFVGGPGGLRLPGEAIQGKGPGQRVDSGRPAEGVVHDRLADVLMPVDPTLRSSAPVLEEVASPAARVYRFDVGDDDDVTPIFLVVDESIDI